MGNFNRGGGGFGGGRGGFGGNRGGGRPSFRREDRGPVTMTKVTCDACHKECEVPFRPTAGKPVFCNDCFRNQGGASQDRGPRRDFGDRPAAPRPSFENNEGLNDLKKQIESLNIKLDRVLASIENIGQAKSSQKTEVVKSMTVSLPKKEVKKEAKKKSNKKK
jgi:DNA-directed RNA polymerase